MLKQIKISPSGCQIWKPQILATANSRFAYASTLAIYIFETKNYQLERVFTHADQNISAIEFEPTSGGNAPRYLAQATADKKLVIWEIENESVKFNVTLGSSVAQIEWSKVNTSQILLLLLNGEVKLVDLNTKSLLTIEVSSTDKPSHLRWHPKRDSLAAIGYKSGRVGFVDVQTLQTFSMSVISETENSGDKGNSVIDLAWDQGEDHLIVGWGNGELAMIDFGGYNEQQTVVRQVYERQTVGVNGIIWRDDKSGDFITSNRKVGTLRLWNAAHKDPKQVLKVGSHGIHSFKKIKGDSQRVLIAFINGAVAVYNVQRRCIDFQTEAGHAETVFDLEFNPSNRDIYASCSYDGTIRVWDASQEMKLLTICDTLRNTPLVQGPEKEEKHIIYSLSWSPKDGKIALVGSLGYLMIFDAMKNGKYLSCLCPAGKGTSSFKVDWNQIDDKFLVMGSQSGQSFVIYVSSDGKKCEITLTIDHKSPVYGVCWSPAIKDEYIVGCADGSVQLCQGSQIAKVIIGHTKRVFNVIYNLTVPDIIASGSDDQTIRIWNKIDGTELKVLRGHSHNVRAIQFNPELPWCLISGAWDATIKLWDCRTGNCIYTISDHTADVYGISFHPKRPFNFISSSRDTTLRFWSMDQLITTLRLQMLIDPTNTKFYDNALTAFQTKGEYRLSSEESQYLIKNVQSGAYKNPIEELRQLYSFLNLNDGQSEIFNILDLLHNIDFHPHPRLQDLKVLHCAQVSQSLRAFAMKLKSASGMQFYNTQYAKKEDRLQEAAKRFLRVGDFRNYCETMFEVGEYQKAIGFAPAVSIEYWQELQERHTDALEKQNNPDAPIAAILANQCDRAVELFAQDENYEDGKLVKALQLTGVFKSVIDTLRSNIKTQDYEKRLLASLDSLKLQDFVQQDPQLAAFVKDEADLFFYQGKPLQAAAAYLSISDFKSAIEILLRNNELYLAYSISKIFYPRALDETTLRLCEKAEKYFQTDLCLKLLAQVKDSSQVAIFKRRLMNSGLLKPNEDQKALDQQYEIQGQQAESSGQLLKSMEQYILANKNDLAAQVALQIYKKSISGQDSQDYALMFEANELLQNVNIAKVPAELRDQILFYAMQAALYRSLWFGLYDLMIYIIQQLQDLSIKIQYTDPLGLSPFLQNLEQALSSHLRLHSDTPLKTPLTIIDITFGGDKAKQLRYQAVLEGLKRYMGERVLFNEAGRYEHQASGQNLQGTKKSAFTHAIIKGYPYTFEDGKTIVSQEEALEWAACNRFSPLNNGFRINPY